MYFLVYITDINKKQNRSYCFRAKVELNLDTPILFFKEGQAQYQFFS